jgi:hypothetical protein
MPLNFLNHFLARAPKTSRKRITRNRFQPELLVLEDRANPAQLWVGPATSMTILQDVNGAGLSFGDTVRVALPNGQYTDCKYGTNAFDSIESAVQAANTNTDASNTIRVLDGLYTLGVPQVHVTKDLSLIGSGQSTTTIQAGVNTLTGGGDPDANTSATILVDRGVSLNVSSLTLSGQSNGGTGIDVPVLIRFADNNAATTVTSILSDVSIQDVFTGGGSASTSGVGIFVANGNVIVANSQFSDIGTHCILYRGVNATGSLLGNIFTGQGSGSHINYGLGAEDLANVTLTTGL